MPGGCFPPEDFRIERSQMLDAIDSEMNDKRRYAITRYIRTLFRGDLASLPRYGSREAVEQLRVEDLTRAYQNLMKSASVEIMFVGGGSPDAALERFASVFEPFGSRTPLLMPDVFPGSEPRELTERMPVTQTKLIAGWTTGIGMNDPLSRPARVMSSLLSGPLSSLLFKEVRERLHLCYYCSSSFDRFRGVLTVESGIEEKQRDALLEAVDTQLRRVAECDYPQELLEDTRMYLADSYRGVEDSLSAVEGFTLGQIMTGSSLTAEEELAALLAVTREEIAEAASRLRPALVYCLAGSGEEEDE